MKLSKSFEYVQKYDLSVFPIGIIPNGKGGYEKKPLITGYTDFAYLQPGKKERLLWEKKLNDPDVGIALGNKSVHVLDEETPEMLSLMTERFLKNQGNTKIILTGSDKGGGHIYFRTPEPLQRLDQYENEGKILSELLGTERWVVSEGTLHPGTGKYWRPANNNNIANIEIEILQKIVYPFHKVKTLREIFEEKRPQRIPSEIWRIISDPTIKSNWNDFSKVVFVLVMLNYTLEGIQSLFETEASQSFLYKRLKKPGEKINRLEYAFKNARRELEKSSSFKIKQELTEYLEKAKNLIIPGRTWAYEKSVLTVFLEKCILFGNYQTKISLREISELAGISLDTARNNLKRLISKGWIVPIKTSGYLVLEATKYEFVPGLFWNGVSNSYSIDTFPSLVLLYGYDTKIGNDLFHFNGLGKNGYELFLLMKSNKKGISVKDILDRRIMSKRTFYRKIEKMLNAGMIEKNGELYCLKDFDQKEVSHKLGTLGKGVIKKQKHKAERKRHSERVEYLYEKQPELFTNKETGEIIEPGLKNEKRKAKAS